MPICSEMLLSAGILTFHEKTAAPHRTPAPHGGSHNVSMGHSPKGPSSTSSSTAHPPVAAPPLHPPAASFGEDEEPPMPIVFSKTGKTQALGVGGGRTMGTVEAGQRGSTRPPIDPENELVSREKGEGKSRVVWV